MGLYHLYPENLFHLCHPCHFLYLCTAIDYAQGLYLLLKC